MTVRLHRADVRPGLASYVCFLTCLCATVGSATTYGLPETLKPDERARMETGIDRGLAALAASQRPDGSFPATRPSGQPGTTSLTVMAFLSAGHRPGFGPYGDALDRAIAYTLSTQRPDGLLSAGIQAPYFEPHKASQTAHYNHAIAGTMLCEVYGLTDADTAALLEDAVVRALGYVRRFQTEEKLEPHDRGGIRYPTVQPHRRRLTSDLSMTAWLLTFYRSARNAEFPVPEAYVDEAVEYVRRCAGASARDPRGRFYYGVGFPLHAPHAMTAAGALALALSGEHDDRLIAESVEWLSARPVRDMNREHWLFYGSYYRAQAFAQAGGTAWSRFFPPHVAMMLDGQRADGRWVSRRDEERRWGETYATSMAILSLTPSYQLLPIYQR